MQDRVKTLVGERRQNKTRINELESMIHNLNDRLFLADRKTSVTANVGKRVVSELQKQVQDLSDEVTTQRNKEARLKRKMEELHFANMVSYEAQMKQEKDLARTANSNLTELVLGAGEHRKRQSSVPARRMAQTIEHD